MILSATNISVRRLKAAIAILVIGLISVPATTPATASPQSIVVGSLRTQSNQPIQSTNINFFEKTNRVWTNSKTDKNGRFIVQLPRGEYAVYISGHQTNRSRCLDATINYSVTEDRQTLSITTPNLKTYTIRYVDESTGSRVSSVTTTLQGLYYKSVENPGLGNVKFFCRREFIRPADSAIWEAFEIDPIETQDSQKDYDQPSNFMFRNGLGQMVTTNMVDVDWNSPNITFSIPDLPSVKIAKKSLKIRNGKLSGQARFSEATVLKEFQLNRKFKVTFRVIRESKPTIWITRSTKSTSVKGNAVSFKLDTQFYRGAKVQVMLTGSNFSLGSNVVTLRIPK